MKSPSLVSKSSLSTTHNLTSALLRRGVMRQLGQLKNGHLVVIENGERLIVQGSQKLRFLPGMPAPVVKPVLQQAAPDATAAPAGSPTNDPAGSPATAPADKPAATDTPNSNDTQPATAAQS